MGMEKSVETKYVDRLDSDEFLIRAREKRIILCIRRKRK